MSPLEFVYWSAAVLGVLLMAGTLALGLVAAYQSVRKDRGAS